MEQNHHKIPIGLHIIKSSQHGMKMVKGVSLHLPIGLALNPSLSTLFKLTMAEQWHSTLGHHNN
jgi:hypothetical protein